MDSNCTEPSIGNHYNKTSIRESNSGGRISFRFSVFTNIMAKPTSFSLRPLVLCGPSGSGKSTLLKKLMGEFPDSFAFSVSHTTRKPRPGEKNGVDYHFVDTRGTMEEAIARGDFLESAEFSGNLYGTSKAAVFSVCDSGRICVLDIDVQGVKQIKELKDKSLCPRFVFIRPPSFEALEERLRARNTETDDSLQKRLQAAKAEMDYGGQPGNFDIVVVNDNLEEAYLQLKNFVIQGNDKNV